MSRIVVTAQAEHDLEDIWLAIAVSNPRAATGILRTIGKKIDLLSEWALLEEEAFGVPERAMALYKRLLQVLPHHGAALRAPSPSSAPWRRANCILPSSCTTL